MNHKEGYIRGLEIEVEILKLENEKLRTERDSAVRTKDMAVRITAVEKKKAMDKDWENFAMQNKMKKIAALLDRVPNTHDTVSIMAAKEIAQEKQVIAYIAKNNNV